MKYLKGVLGLVLISALVACAPLHQHQHQPDQAEEQLQGQTKVLDSHDIKQALELGINNEPWVEKLYKKYQSKGGYKALAIASPSLHHIDTLGYSAGMLTAQFARQRALQWCRASSKGIAPCRVVVEQSAQPPYRVSQADIDHAPAQLKSYNSVRRYQAYEQGRGHKAFALATGSGETFWDDQQVSEKTARRKALNLCNTYKNRIAGDCEILRSQ